MWKIKYPEIKQKTNQFFTDKEIDNECVKQMHDGTDHILLRKGLAKKSNSTSNIEITIPKNEFEIVFNPNGWNPFPCVRPPECGEYLVTFKDEDADYVQQNYFDNLGRWETAHSDVIAFRALPAPYQPETRK